MGDGEQRLHLEFILKSTKLAGGLDARGEEEGRN